MTLDLFAGLPVSDYQRALAWYERLLGSEPAFLPDDTEAVWELAEHRYFYIDVLPERAGNAVQTVSSTISMRGSRVSPPGVSRPPPPRRTTTACAR
ncbi:VOC family protein [Prauserella sp. PE36]|uniref:VOC family protein n=1 Tax=Prauserella sp. PE36 TaxID=1504709 RepID=UPI002692A698